MKCSNCGKKNMSKANFCKKCGFVFSDKEQKDSKDTLILLKGTKKFYEVITLKFITDSVLIQTIYTITILLIGVGILSLKENKIRIEDGKNYTVQYNTEIKEYYMIIQSNKESTETIDANLFIPNNVEALKIAYYDENDKLIAEEEHSPKGKITLSINQNHNNYYQISDTKNQKDSIKVFVYYQSDIEEQS